MTYLRSVVRFTTRTATTWYSYCCTQYTQNSFRSRYKNIKITRDLYKYSAKYNTHHVNNISFKLYKWGSNYLLFYNNIFERTFLSIYTTHTIQHMMCLPSKFFRLFQNLFLVQFYTIIFPIQ